MTARQQRAKRREEIIKTLYIISESFRSHMPDTAKKGTHGNPEFHARAMVGYAEVSLVWTRELYRLTKEDYERVYE